MSRIRPPATRPSARPVAPPAPQAGATPPPQPRPAPAPAPSPAPTPQPTPAPTPNPPPTQPTPPSQRNAAGDSVAQQTADIGNPMADTVGSDMPGGANGVEDTAKQARAAKSREAQQRRWANMVHYPGTVDAEGKPQLLDAVPTDFDGAIHRALKRADFAHPAVYHQFRAQEYRRMADKHDADAAEALANPNAARSGKRAASAGKLAKMSAQMIALRQLLESQGVDVDTVLREQGLLEDEYAAGEAAAQEEPQAV